MLSYRHSFHAGNFADVLKHIVLVEILTYLGKKESPYDYIDCHAGAGIYNVDSAEGQKLEEYRLGIGRLLNLDWPELESYLSIIRSFNSASKLKKYPGSPLLALKLMRPRDRAWLYELHPADYRRLCSNIGNRENVRLMQQDSLKAFPALLPPASRRGVVLLDPSYEVKSDYSAVVKALQQGYRRFSTGVYALWYPVVDRRRIDRLERDLKATGIRNIQRFELGVRADYSTTGMTASGMIVINPTWGLFETMQQLLPRLAKRLGIDGEDHYQCDILANE